MKYLKACQVTSVDTIQCNIVTVLPFEAGDTDEEEAAEHSAPRSNEGEIGRFAKGGNVCEWVYSEVA